MIERNEEIQKRLISSGLCPSWPNHYKKCAITFDGINTYSSEFEYIKQCIYYRIFMILFQDFLKILKRCEHEAFEMLSLVIHVDMLKVIILFR